MTPAPPGGGLSAETRSFPMPGGVSAGSHSDRSARPCKAPLLPRRNTIHPAIDATEGSAKPTFPIFNRKGGVCGARVPRSTRFQQLWISLWITPDFYPLMGRHWLSACMAMLGIVPEGNTWTFRASDGQPPVENGPLDGYNGGVFLAHAVIHSERPRFAGKPPAQPSETVLRRKRPPEGRAATPAGVSPVYDAAPRIAVVSRVWGPAPRGPAAGRQETTRRNTGAASGPGRRCNAAPHRH